MPFPIFNRNSLAFFATLAATLTLFASSLFYNRIEAPLAILILIAAILLRGHLFTYFHKIKKFANRPHHLCHIPALKRDQLW